LLVDIEETHARPAAQNSQPGYSARKTRSICSKSGGDVCTGAWEGGKND